MKHRYSYLKAALLAIGAASFSPTTAQISLTATGGTTAAGYTTLGAAFNAINAGTHTGAINISVTSSTTEPAMCQLNPSGVTVGSTTASYTSVYIKPAAGLTPSITGNIPGPSAALIKLNGADNVTIDGSNTANGTTRDLMLYNEHSSSSTNAVVWITAYGTGDGATNNTIKNCRVYGYLGNYYMVFAAIANSGSTINNVSTLAANSGNTYQNNLLGYAQYGILDLGYNTGTYDENVVIADNDVRGITYRGIWLANQSNARVSGNTITAVTTLLNQNTSGIYVSSNIAGGAICNNRINDIKNPNTGGYGSAGIHLNSPSSANGLLVYNNFIWDVASYSIGSGASHTTSGHGMVITAGSGYRVYHNTVNLTTNQTVSTAVSAALYVAGTASGLDIRDNLLANNQTTGTRYSIYSAVAGTAFSSLDNNDYYSGGTLGYLGGAISTLTSWKTATGKDQSSLNIAPVFAGAGDLHLATSGNAALSNKGVFLTVDTLDIDGQARSRSLPDIGADEFGPDPLPLDILRFNAAREGGRVRLDWHLADADGLRLELQRSNGNSEFNPVLEEAAASGSCTRYDGQPFQGTNIYRLRLLRPDGSYSFSRQIRIDNRETAAGITVAPNPVRDRLYIRGAFRRAELYSMSGSLLHRRGSDPMIDLSAFPAGTYHLKLFGDQQEVIWQGRLLKQ